MTTTTPVHLTVTAANRDHQREAEREKQCPARAHGTCQKINQHLGYPIGLGLRLCDACHAHGPETQNGEAVRDSIIAETVRCNIAGFAHHSPVIRDATLRLVDRPLAIRLIQSSDQLPEIERQRMADMLDGKVPPATSPAGSLEADRQNWEQAEAWTQRQRSQTLLQSILSRFILGRANRQTRERRERSCFGDSTLEPCPNLKASKRAGRHYCTACGCGDKPWALLDSPRRLRWWQRGPLRPYSKLDYPMLKCPRRRDGFSNARPNDEPDRHHLSG